MIRCKTARRQGRVLALVPSVLPASLFILSLPALAQDVDARRGKTIVVGAPAAGARSDRVDAARTGLARSRLPAARLRKRWPATSAGATIDRAPLVDGEGDVFVVGTRGEVVVFAPDGAERWRASTAAVQPGPAVLLADESIAFVGGSGEAVDVKAGSVRWRTRFGRADATRLGAPIALDDGGVVVAASQDLSSLDAEGHERSRTTLPEPTGVPLVSALGKVIAIGASGTVWAWTPGEAEPSRIATFGSPVDGGAALADDHTLVAVSASQLHFTAIDLTRGTATTRAVAAAGLWLGPPAMRGAEAHLLVQAPARELAVAIDARGDEVSRATLVSRAPPVAPDGGPSAPLVAPPHTPPLVDRAGTLAFATIDGALGVLVSDGTIEILPDACPPAKPSPSERPAPAVAGLAPLGDGAFVAACHSGAVVTVGGGEPADAAL